ncbi:MAG: hypothetical protein DMF81_25475, partial [Acidobacteria bacterium]
MRVRGAGILFASATLAAGGSARPAAACDSASCALLTRGPGVVPKGEWVVDLSFRYTDEGQPLLGSTPA